MSPNWWKKAKELAATGVVKRGEVAHVTFLHDDWCAHLKGCGVCNCAPDARIDWIARKC